MNYTGSGYGVAQQQARLPDSAVADEEQLDQVVTMEVSSRFEWEEESASKYLLLLVIHLSNILIIS